MPEPIALQHPVLVYVRGIPGSGKTYIASAIAEALADRVGSENIVTLDPDATDYQSEAYQKHVAQMEAEGVDPALFAYRFLRAQAYEGIAKNRVVVWNQPFTNIEIFNKMIGRMRDQAVECNVELAILVIEVSVDPEVARQRVKDRKARGGHGPSEGTFDRFVRDYHSFAEYGYDTVQVRGDTGLAEIIGTVAPAIEQYL